MPRIEAEGALCDSLAHRARYEAETQLLSAEGAEFENMKTIRKK
jgi:hypothetical protein